MRSSSRPRRRAYVLAETAVAGLLVGAAMVLAVKLLGWTAAERRAAERRGWAVQEAANAMEAIAALPFDRLSIASAEAAAKLSRSASEVLPGGRIEVQVADDPPLKRIDLAVRWQGTSGVSEAPVRLTAWVASKGTSP